MKAQFIETLNAAVKKNLSLRNATFYKKVDNSIFDNEGSYTEGVFIVLENGKYDWTQTHYLGEPDYFSQIVVLDGTLYTYISMGLEEQNEWETFEEETYKLEEMIGPLLESSLKEEYLENVQVEESGDSKYLIELSEAYFMDFKEEAVEGIRRVISQMDEKEFDFIHAANEQIKAIQERKYIHVKIKIVINEEGYLVGFEESSTYKEADIETEEITIYQDYQLKEYNLDNPTSLFPEIGSGRY